MSEIPRLYAIIPVFRPRPDMLDRVSAHIPADRLIFVENDGVRLSSYPVQSRLNRKKNPGYGGGANTGARLALSRGARWLVFLNQDLEIGPGVWPELEKKLTGLKPGVYGPFTGSLDPKRYTSKLDSQPTGSASVYVSGSFLLVHRDVFLKTGGFWEPYFMYYEDVELSLSAARSGFPVAYLSVRGVIDRKEPVYPRGSVFHEYYLARNHLVFVFRNAPLKVRWREIFRLPYTLFIHTVANKRTAIMGIADALAGKMGERRVFPW